VFKQAAPYTFQAAAGGERVAYAAEAGEAGGIGLSADGDQWLAQRTPTGWQPQNITPVLPNENSVGEPVFQAFSPDLSSAIFEEPRGPVPLAAGVSDGCRALDMATGLTAQVSLTALFTAAQPGSGCGLPLFAGESANGQQIVFQTEGALTPGSQEATEIPQGHENHHNLEQFTGEGCGYGCNLYEAGEGRLTLVNQIEEHGALHQVPNATLGGYGGEAANEGGQPDFSGAVSADGSRVFWTDTAPESEGHPVEEVFVLENGRREVKVSGAHSQYWTSTPDGHFAYYVEDEGQDTGRLYRFNTETNKPEELTHAGAGVISVLGTNTTGGDGEYVYFVAKDENEVLPPGAGEFGEPKVYVIHDGVTSLVATASGSDSIIEVAGGAVHKAAPWVGDLGLRQAEVSPDGTHLVFQTQASATGFDNESAVEVFVYSADEGKLVCVSCDAAGTPPEGDEARSGKLTVSAESHTYAHRWMSADGDRVFFNTSQPLVPGDVNGVEDVYEWEREGTGSCPVQAPASTVGGCQYLLSGGVSEKASFFVDADASGENVFFVHMGPLGHLAAPFDHLELYDARVNGGFPQPGLACTGTGCQGVPPAPPSFATPATVTFAGAGNFPAEPAPGGRGSNHPATTPPPAKRTVKCKKPKRLTHNRCVAPKRSKKRTGKR
jgi:hypothetical protein